MAEILVVEDNRLEQERIRDCLGVEHALRFASSAAAARRALDEATPELILLDITLPDAEGYDLFASLRDQGLGSDIPVIFLTGRGEPQDKVRAFSLGADDYVVKPFEPLELRARVDARLAKREGANILRRGPLQLDPKRMRVELDEEGALDLTPNEFRLLFRLAERPGQACTRDELLETLWGDTAVTPRTIDTHIYSLRNKLGAYRGLVETVSRVGYRFNEKLPD